MWLWECLPIIRFEMLLWELSTSPVCDTRDAFVNMSLSSGVRVVFYPCERRMHSYWRRYPSPSRCVSWLHKWSCNRWRWCGSRPTNHSANTATTSFYIQLIFSSVYWGIIITEQGKYLVLLHDTISADYVDKTYFEHVMARIERDCVFWLCVEYVESDMNTVDLWTRDWGAQVVELFHISNCILISHCMDK